MEVTTPPIGRVPDADSHMVQRILQFGTGRFLRGFVGAFVQDANEAAGQGRGRVRAIDIVESTGSGMAQRLAAQAGRYHLLVRGLRGGQRVDESRLVTCIDRTLDLQRHPDGVWAAGVDPDLRTIVSNATEAGYRPGRDAFPARLLEVLVRRARAGLPGVTVLPCELVERNGEVLRGLVRDAAVARSLPFELVTQVLDGNAWAVTLVDRIVTSPPAGLSLAADDALAVAAEPYASWIVELGEADAIDASVPEHAAVRRVPDVGPFALRKIRILNGAHTALVARARGSRWALVREAMADDAIATWLEELLRDEVVPALGERIDDGEAFVSSVLERFRNPFLDHRLADIAENHAVKLTTRILPSFQEYRHRFGRRPTRLGWVLTQDGMH